MLFDRVRLQIASPDHALFGMQVDENQRPVRHRRDASHDGPLELEEHRSRHYAAEGKRFHKNIVSRSNARGCGRRIPWHANREGRYSCKKCQLGRPNLADTCREASEDPTARPCRTAGRPSQAVLVGRSVVIAVNRVGPSTLRPSTASYAGRLPPAAAEQPQREQPDAGLRDEHGPEHT